MTTPARRVAFEVIRAVSESDAYANLLLPTALERAGLSGAEAGLATELAYGTLRRRGYYDRVIEVVAGRPVSEIDPPVLDVLRLAAHQLLSMRVAQHAAVNEAVSLARSVASRSATGFVNGVLRTISRTEPAEWLARVVAEAAGEDERLAARHAHPAWIVRVFRQALAAEGREGELEALLEADNQAPEVSLVALPGLARREELEGVRPGRLSPFGAISSGGDPAGHPAVREGRVRIQDEGSQLAALALSRARPIAAGERWLDLCAGPGGKSALLAAEARTHGAGALGAGALGTSTDAAASTDGTVLKDGPVLVANEVVPARAQLVRNALAVFPNPPQVLVGDGRALGQRLAGQFDRVLLDAPCTGLGALRRRPEARWRKQPADVPELTALQLALLESAALALAPGGILAYVTCSPHPAETRVVVEHAIRRLGLTALDTPAVLESLATGPLELGDGLQAQLWPHRHGTDAMFVALLGKP